MQGVQIKPGYIYSDWGEYQFGSIFKVNEDTLKVNVGAFKVNLGAFKINVGNRNLIWSYLKLMNVCLISFNS